MMARTPPSNTQKDLTSDVIYPCCERDDQYDGMVQCGRCLKWHHFSCVGVDQSVAELVWYCRTCLGEDVSARESLGQPGVTRVQPPRAAKKGKDHTGKSKDKTVQRRIEVTVSTKDRKEVGDPSGGQHVINKGQVECQPGTSKAGGISCSDKLLSNNPSRNRYSVSNRNSCSESQKSVESSERSRSTGNNSKSKGSKRDLALMRIEEMKERSRLEAMEEENQLQMLKLKQKQIERKRRELEELQQLSKLVEEESECNEDHELQDNIEVDYIDKVQGWMSSCHALDTGRRRELSNPSESGGGEFAIMSTADTDGMARRRYMQQKSSSMLAGPSKLQIASRQVFPKNLPSFSGHPQDWPLFISAYEQANVSCGFTNAENLVRLQQALQGKALETVRNLLLLPENVPTIIEKLRRRFGNPEILSAMLAQRIQKLDGPDSENLESVIEFGSAIEEFTQHLEVSKLNDHLKNPILMQGLIQKLPPCYAMQWVEYKRRSQVVDLKTFGKFMEDLVDKALEVTFERIDLISTKKREKPKAKVFTHLMEDDREASSSKHVQQSNKVQAQTSARKDISCSICEELGHFGRDCQEFRNASVEQRWRMVRHLNLCTLCIYNHGKWPCKSKIQCEVKGCQDPHHPLLHPPTYAEAVHKEARCNSHCSLNKTVLFRIIPVTLYSEANKFSTLALVDEGSSTSLIDSEIAEFLQLNGPREPFEMRWTNGISRTETHSRSVEMKISGRNSKNYDTCVARTVKKLELPSQRIDATQLVEEFQHLGDIDIQSYELDTPKLLIGIDNMHIIAPLASRVGKKGEPIAVRCKLGWTVYGPRPNMIADVHFLGHHRCVCEECSKADQELSQMLRDNFQLEAVGVSPVRLESKQDCKARSILERTAKRIGNRFEIGLLWKDNIPTFPDSYSMAYKRLKNLEVRLNRNPGIRENLQKQIEDYVTKGYAHKITERELIETPPDRCWYLPLSYVVNPKKPGKIRMVWDAAAKANGVSFNDSLLKGPDMVASLSTVINGFRERRVAFGGDIREMFHQIFVRHEDRQAQRFLFRYDVNCEPDIYVMDVVIFGASCSPCLAQYIKNMNALEHLQQYPAAADAVIRKHYVDDYFDSVDTEDDAIERAKDVRTVHAQAGFEIRNWMSNSPKVLAELDSSYESKEAKSLDGNNTDSEKVLGVMWRSDLDSFVFSTEIREDLRQYVTEGAWPTKRIALRCVMSMFDPKQFLAPLLIHGRILMQDLWRSGIGWDEKIGQVHYKQWLRWTGLFPLINNIRVPRCYLGEMSRSAYDSVQLHVFTDAGEDAYGCVAYFRFVDDKNVHCAFVEAKAKVAPLQYLSIPRKELEAAVLGARLLKTICENHSVKVKKCYLWTDSNAVISWVKSDVRRYKPFVAHRIGEILSITNPENWNWVPTKSNAADDVTKWGLPTQISSDSRWFRGPEFLYKPEEEWPEQKQRVFEAKEELRASVLLHEIILPDVILSRLEHISKWKVLLRTVATMYRFVTNCQRRMKKQPIEALPSPRKGVIKVPAELVPLRQAEYLAAENFLWRVAQGAVFPDEVKTLIRNQQPSVQQLETIEKSSPLYRLSPFLDEYGVIRMEGRTTAAKYAAFDVRFPIVLPKEHPIVRKLVELYHEECGHGSREMVVNEMIQRFYIPRLRSLVESTAKKCVWCKIQKAKPAVPRMAPLPSSRLAVSEHPFAYVGLDYFGPLEVIVGRRREKRWVALFTCMTVRAIHLEEVYSLTTKSCEMAIRRFVKRRGSPIEIFSDNGTNFVGASRDLAEQIRTINIECADTFTGARTKWTFIPPSAPHMGGVWERMVRSVKEAMSALMNGERLTDEILQTALVEAESLINSRPLTYVSTNVKEDREALTPNHFLRGCSLVESTETQRSIDLADRLRNSYNQAQYLAEELWSRWQREYLPTMNRRTKWFEEMKPMAVGDLVYVADTEKRRTWERGIIEEVFPGSDGRVRSAMVRTNTGLKKRAVAKLAVLEMGG